MIDAQALLRDVKRLTRALENDLRETHEDSGASHGLKAEWSEARAANRTAHTFDAFREDEVTQSAVHWVLACVFLRFIEDNGLIDRPWLAGPGERMLLARDRQADYFRERPHDSDLDYLLLCFDRAATLPGLAGLFDRKHNPLFRLPLSGDGAMALLDFFRKVDPDTGTLLHDFTDAGCSTRFLGDLYQDLSEAARKRYALLQTPEFVERFILERTLDPAIREFGFREVNLIDPACGSGHFLLGTFERLFGLWVQHEPGLNLRAAAQRALDAIAGVDINPFAAEIARFRLLLEALKASSIGRLKDAPDFKIYVAIGDSLLHGRLFGHLDLGDNEGLLRLRAHRYVSEDNGTLSKILGRPYHAVVANPPYITPKDDAENAAYRTIYSSCHKKYALVVPFIERCFDLAIDGRQGRPAGFVGVIVANSFMKREFGKKLIEKFLPSVELTHVVDTSGAYIPGHGTPTAILFGRNHAPVERTVRAVMGVKGEPSPPHDPAQGIVWSAIRTQIDRPGSESEFVTVADIPRSTFAKHPWSIGGGGAADLKESIGNKRPMLGSIIDVIGRTTHTGEDDAFYFPADAARRNGWSDFVVPLVIGEDVRDYSVSPNLVAVFPYDKKSAEVWNDIPESASAHFWALRTTLRKRKDYNQTIEQRGLRWYEYSMFFPLRYQVPLSITFAFVATHNHFVLDRGGKLFNRSAPVIKLPLKATEEKHVGVFGLLNSSTGCFWMKQIFHNKGSTVDERGARQRTDAYEDFFEYTATGLKSFPLVHSYPLDLASALDSLGCELGEALPVAVLARAVPTRATLDESRANAATLRKRMIALQEELDWRCYAHYRVINEKVEHPSPPSLNLGERAFEIVMARQMAAGELETHWFDRHGSIPITDLPAYWPADYQAVVERRIALIESDRGVGLIERPEYKRRWSIQPWEELEGQALRNWLLDRLEEKRFWSGEPALLSTNRLADLAAKDSEFRQAAELYAGRPDVDLPQLVKELVSAESVPLLSVLRYTDSGLRKRKQWQETWTLQHCEDAIDEEVEGQRATFASLERQKIRRVIEDEYGRQRGETEEEYTLRILASLDAQKEEIARRTDEAVLHEQNRQKADRVGNIPAPPKYRTADFQCADFWRLRGGLDVPKERFVIYPHCEREGDGSPVVSWAGFNHLQQARAIATYYLERKERDGWGEGRLKPLLAGVVELLPWLIQWHNAHDPTYGMGMGDYFRSFVEEEARALATTPENL
jgi:hypothetical protein